MPNITILSDSSTGDYTGNGISNDLVWRLWQPSVNITTNISLTDALTGDTWALWNATFDAGTGGSITAGDTYVVSNGHYWRMWNQTFVVNGGTQSYAISRMPRVAVQEQPETDEQRAARIAEAAERARKAEEERLVREREERRAKRLAKLLLLGHLDAAQRKAYREKGCFRVVGGMSGKEYEIDTRHGQARNVYLIEGGKRRRAFCAHPREVLVPDADAYLAQKLMLEASEEEFLRIANKTELAAV